MSTDTATRSRPQFALSPFPPQSTTESHMGNNNATLETLAAFAICFAAGALSSLGLLIRQEEVFMLRI